MNRISFVVLMVFNFHLCAGLAYDPLAASGAVRTEDVTFSDMSRHREIPMRVYLPEPTAAAPVIFSELQSFISRRPA